MTASRSTFEFVAHWQTKLPDEEQAVVAFWQSEDALGEDIKADLDAALKASQKK